MKWLVLLRVEINQISKYSENGSWETLTALMAGESLEDELNSFLTPLSQLGTESFLYFQCIVISIYAPWQSVVSLLIVACDGAGLIRVTVHSRWPDLAPASVRRMGTRGRRPQLMARHPLASPQERQKEFICYIVDFLFFFCLSLSLFVALNLIRMCSIFQLFFRLDLLCKQDIWYFFFASSRPKFNLLQLFNFKLYAFNIFC